MMSLMELMENVKKFYKEHHVPFREQETEELLIDFPSIPVDKCRFFVLQGVKEFFQFHSPRRASFVLDDFFHLHQKKFFYRREDQLKLYELCMKFLKETSIDDEMFYQIFRSDYFREKDRLRALMKRSSLIISTEKEEKIWEKVLEVTNLFLQFYLNLLSEKEFSIQVLPYILELQKPEFVWFFDDPSAFMNSLSKSFSSDNKKFIEPILHNWYQKNEHTFLHANASLKWYRLKKWHFLLTEEQKQIAAKHVLSNLKQDMLDLKNSNCLDEESRDDAAYILHASTEIFQWAKEQRLTI